MHFEEVYAPLLTYRIYKLHLYTLIIRLIQHGKIKILETFESEFVLVVIRQST